MPRGIRFALPVALRRGHVMVFVPSCVNIGEFLITGNGLFVMVAVRFARKIRATLYDMGAEFAEVIEDLRLVPRTGPVSCELWLYSRYGTFRCFRVNDDALVELDLYGLPRNLANPVAVAGTATRGPPLPGPGNPAAPEVMAALPVDKRGPILRYLAKWNASRLAGRKVWETEGSELRAILNAGEPAEKTKLASVRKPDAPRQSCRRAP